MAEGDADGLAVGTNVGMLEFAAVGSAVGVDTGLIVGTEIGFIDGIADGAALGANVDVDTPISSTCFRSPL